MTKQIQEILLKPLSSPDAGNAYELYLDVHQRIPRGYLGDKNLDDFERLLSDPHNSGGIGAFIQNQLVAFTLYRRIRNYPFGGIPPFLHTDINPETIAEGVGSVINPEYQGRNLWHQLILSREHELKALGINHLIGLIYQPNSRSIASFLKTGGLFIDFYRDQFGLNYVSYYGDLMKGVHQNSTVPELIDMTDIKTQAKCFADNRIATGIQKTCHRDSSFWSLRFSHWS